MGSVCVDDLVAMNSSRYSTTPIVHLRRNSFTFASCQASSFLAHISSADSKDSSLEGLGGTSNVVSFENASIHASFTLDRRLGSESTSTTRSFVVSIFIVDATMCVDSVSTGNRGGTLVASFPLSVLPGMELPHQISICKVKATEADGKFLSFSIVAAGSLRSLDSYLIKVECSHLLCFSMIDLPLGSISEIDLSKTYATSTQQQGDIYTMTMRTFKNALVRAVTVSDRGVAAVTFDCKVVFLDIDDDNDDDDDDDDDECDSNSGS